jgi:hypothetical protein
MEFNPNFTYMNMSVFVTDFCKGSAITGSSFAKSST